MYLQYWAVVRSVQGARKPDAENVFVAHRISRRQVSALHYVKIDNKWQPLGPSDHLLRHLDAVKQRTRPERRRVENNLPPCTANMAEPDVRKQGIAREQHAI
jgi:hypothetical protein